MKVPTVIAPNEEQAPLRIPYSNVQAGPAAFGAAVAQGIGNVANVAQDIAETEARNRVATEVFTLGSVAADKMNQTETKAVTTYGPNAAKADFVSNVEKELQTTEDDALKSATTPAARALLQRRLTAQRVSAVDSARRHAAGQTIKAKQEAAESYQISQINAAKLAPLDEARQRDSITDVAMSTRAQMADLGYDKTQIDQEIEKRVSGMLLDVAQSIANPMEAAEYYEKYKDAILPSDAKKEFESALQVKANDTAGEMLARAVPKDLAYDDGIAWLQTQTKDDKSVARYDEGVQRYTAYHNAKLAQRKQEQAVYFEQQAFRLHQSGYQMGIFSAGQIATMGADNYHKLESWAESFHREKAAKATAAGEFTDAEAAHFQNWINFQRAASQDPRLLIDGRNFWNEWGQKLGEKYSDEGLKLWNKLVADVENPGTETVQSLQATAVVEDQLRRSAPRKFPPADSAAQWSPDAMKTYVGVKGFLDEKIKAEQGQHPGKVPSLTELKAWTVEAIQEVKLRESGKVVPAYTLTPAQLGNEQVVLPADEQRFREWLSGQRTVTEPVMRQMYIDWIANGRPPLPGQPVQRNIMSGQ